MNYNERNAKKTELTDLYNKLMKEYAKMDNEWAKDCDYVVTYIKDNPNLTAEQISVRTGSRFSKESITMFGYWANEKRNDAIERVTYKGRYQRYAHPVSASMPTLQRKRASVTRHYAELDENGDIIPESKFEKTTAETVYYVE